MYADKEIDFTENGKTYIRVKLICCDCTACWYCNRIEKHETKTRYFCRLHDKEVHLYQEPCKDFC